MLASTTFSSPTDARALSAEYVRSINEGDAAAFRELFAEDAVVDDNGRVVRGRGEIVAWGDREIFAVRVRLEVRESQCTPETASVTTKVDGDFDRTGLPDPVVIVQQIDAAGGKIAKLTCRLAP